MEGEGQCIQIWDLIIILGCHSHRDIVCLVPMSPMGPHVDQCIFHHMDTQEYLAQDRAPLVVHFQGHHKGPKGHFPEVLVCHPEFQSLASGHHKQRSTSTLTSVQEGEYQKDHTCHVDLTLVTQVLMVQELQDLAWVLPSQHGLEWDHQVHPRDLLDQGDLFLDLALALEGLDQCQVWLLDQKGSQWEFLCLVKDLGDLLAEQCSLVQHHR